MALIHEYSLYWDLQQRSHLFHDKQIILIKKRNWIRKQCLSYSRQFEEIDFDLNYKAPKLRKCQSHRANFWNTAILKYHRLHPFHTFIPVVRMKSSCWDAKFYSIFLYRCESLTLNPNNKRRIYVFQMFLQRRMLCTSWLQRVTNNIQDISWK